MKQYMLTSPAYLNIVGSPPGTSPVYVESDTIVGEGTAYDFQGPPSRAMRPLNEAAEAALAEVEAGYSGGPPTVKGTTGPSEGGASPFDPASTDKSSDAEKAKAAEAEKAAAAKEEAERKKAEEDKKKAEAAKASTANK